MDLKTKRKFYKEIRYAITLAVERFYQGRYFPTYAEDLKWKNKTIRSVFNEYKRNSKLLAKDGLPWSET